MLLGLKTDTDYMGLDKCNINKKRLKHVELHLFEFFTDVCETIERAREMFPELEYITLHPPYPVTDLITIFNSDSLYGKLLAQVKEVIQNTKDIQVNLLVHESNQGVPLLEHTETITRLRRLLEKMEGSKTYLMLENMPYHFSWHILMRDTEFLDLPITLQHPNLNLCFDMCHYKIVHYKRPEFTIDSRMFDYIHQIHFSGTGRRDGFRFSETHGCPHASLDEVREDLNLLEHCRRGTVLIPEIMESDYTARIELNKELDFLMSLNRFQ